MQYSENVSWNRPGWRFSAVPQFDNPDQKSPAEGPRNLYSVGSPSCTFVTLVVDGGWFGKLSHNPAFPLSLRRARTIEDPEPVRNAQSLDRCRGSASAAGH